MASDSAIWVYSYTLVIELYLFGLFLSEWVRVRSPNVVFMLFAVLFLGLASVTGGTLWARVLFHIDIPARDAYICGPFWTLRYLIMSAILTVVAVYFTRRFIRRRRKQLKDLDE